MERIVTASLMLLIAGLAQLSTAHPFYFPPKDYDGPDVQDVNDVKLQQDRYPGHISYKARDDNDEPSPGRQEAKLTQMPQNQDVAHVNYNIRDTYALTIVMNNHYGRRIQVYNGRDGFGPPLAQLDISGFIHNTKKDSGNNIAYQPSYTEPGGRTGGTRGTVYYFNLKKLLHLTSNTPCSLFVSQTNFPLIGTTISYGADSLGTKQGREIFGSNSGYTFWIAVNKEYFLLQQTNSAWVGSIICQK